MQPTTMETIGNNRKIAVFHTADISVLGDVTVTLRNMDIGCATIARIKDRIDKVFHMP